MKGRSLIAWSALALLVLSGACASGLPLTIGVPVQQEGLATTESWALLCRRLQGDGGVEVRLMVLRDHGAAMENLRDRFVDVALVDPAWYLEERRSLVPLLQARAVRQDAPRVCLIVPRLSICYRPADLAGRSLALTRAGQEAAGFFVPLAMLAEAGVVLSDPKRLVFAETFDSILKGVAYESLEAGAVPSYVLETGRGPALGDFIRVIGTSAPLPHALLVGRAADDPALYAPMVRAFLGLSSTEAGRQALLQAGYADFALPDGSGFGALERYLRLYRDAYGAPD